MKIDDFYKLSDEEKKAWLGDYKKIIICRRKDGTVYLRRYLQKK